MTLSINYLEPSGLLREHTFDKRRFDSTGVGNFFLVMNQVAFNRENFAESFHPNRLAEQSNTLSSESSAAPSRETTVNRSDSGIRQSDSRSQGESKAVERESIQVERPRATERDTKTQATEAKEGKGDGTVKGQEGRIPADASAGSNDKSKAEKGGQDILKDVKVTKVTHEIAAVAPKKVSAGETVSVAVKKTGETESLKGAEAIEAKNVKALAKLLEAGNAGKIAPETMANEKAEVKTELVRAFNNEKAKIDNADAGMIAKESFDKTLVDGRKQSVVVEAGAGQVKDSIVKAKKVDRRKLASDKVVDSEKVSGKMAAASEARGEAGKAGEAGKHMSNNQDAFAPKPGGEHGRSLKGRKAEPVLSGAKGSEATAASKQTSKSNGSVTGFNDQAWSTNETGKMTRAGKDGGATLRNEIFRQVEKGLEQAYIVRPKSVSLKLSPEELGEMKVKVVMEQDQLSARIQVESQKVVAILKDNQASLEHRLREQGMELTKFDVRQEDMSGHQQAFQGNEGREGQGATRTERGHSHGSSADSGVGSAGLEDEYYVGVAPESAPTVVDGEAVSFTV